MKSFVLGLVAAVGLAGAVAADPLEGIWQTEVDDGSYALVTVSPCGPAFCGVISRTFNSDGEYQSENIGRQIVIDMVAEGDGHYEGSVWRPSNDKIYIGKMDIEGNTVRLRGCVAGGLICASQTWTKVQ
ncbi:DUF2147 domain-containing protein [Loktanella sp. IMCC34160]|uniref:DUF2147 domain-containing protein n=1 Tax=Loktanella sp. IMCC34160 TaxID=2510646 RepID=UPI00101D43CD|nr:DUF2147 domain-containing protein [Loktanella sp. IMCC34160]RYG93141.1 DUF2147 domain-containing protein [Loktanella sp. IMCC34160]